MPIRYIRVPFQTALLTLSVLVLISVPVPVFSQTFEDPQQPVEPLDAADEPAPETEVVLDESIEEALQAAETTDQEEFDSFVPSEDISEDYSVPFPVDI